MTFSAYQVLQLVINIILLMTQQEDCSQSMKHSIFLFIDLTTKPLSTHCSTLRCCCCCCLGMKCTGFPGPGAMTSLLANPMQEFIESDGHEKVHEMFEHFLLKFPKKYANTVDTKEHNHRRDVFRQNLR